MRLVSSITTVKNYDNALNNLFNSLTFSNLDSDINLMKRKNKSDHSILMVLKFAKLKYFTNSVMLLL